MGGRLIPAHAGSTTTNSCRTWRPWAHPRSRGEHLEGGVSRCQRSGSSPLTRGARRVRCRRRVWPGLIPAHAGSTDKTDNRLVNLRAHPRSRGEHSVTLPSGASFTGSSPLTRGARENRPQWGGQGGSSPLTRGAPRRSTPCTVNVGLIPAHAGSTQPRLAIPFTFPAHPRSRGEHHWPSSWNLVIAGSSPLTRGAQALAVLTEQGWGLIPAHAGSTWCRCAFWFPSWAHPRSRGEHLKQSQTHWLTSGSSPLTRGALPHR